MIELLIISVVAICFAAVCFFGSPFLPTKKVWAKESLSLMRLGENDMVVDLGSGDGRILKLLSGEGVRSVGYELNPLLVALSKIRLVKTNLATVEMKNYWKINLPKNTTAVYAFMVERDALKLEKYIERQAKLVNAQELKLIVFGFDLPNKAPIKKLSGSRLYIFE